MSSSLGPLVRLHGISISQLVPGGRGTSANAVEDERTQWDGPTLDAFVTDIIAEAVPFIDAVAPKSGAGSTWKRKGSPRHYSSSEAAVHLFERVVSGTEIGQIRGMDHSSAESKDETWFCRRSCHRNAAEKGTATWQEFIRSFKDHHPQTEEDFTPTVIGARTAISWNTGNLVIDAAGERWNNVTLKVVEMKHKIDPKPLKNRTFPVLQLAANLVGVQEFIVVSIPITDFQRSPHAQYAKDKSLVVAAYTSIERVRVLPETGEVEWIMATASDAKGVLPQWMQNLAVPGKVAHDVDMFLSWIPSQRNERNNKPASMTRSSTLDKSHPAAPAISGTTGEATVSPPPISKTEGSTFNVTSE